MAYKLYKELERMLRTINIPLSVDKVMDIAKTISSITVKVADGVEVTKTMLLTDEQRMLAPLLPPKSQRVSH